MFFINVVLIRGGPLPVEGGGRPPQGPMYTTDIHVHILSPREGSGEGNRRRN